MSGNNLPSAVVNGANTLFGFNMNRLLDMMEKQAGGETTMGGYLFRTIALHPAVMETSPKRKNGGVGPKCQEKPTGNDRLLSCGQKGSNICPKRKDPDWLPLGSLSGSGHHNYRCDTRQLQFADLYFPVIPPSRRFPTTNNVGNPTGRALPDISVPGTALLDGVSLLLFTHGSCSLHFSFKPSTCTIFPSLTMSTVPTVPTAMLCQKEQARTLHPWPRPIQHRSRSMPRRADTFSLARRSRTRPVLHFRT